MLGPFFRVAMLSVSRQSAFRRAVVVHLILVAALVFLVSLVGVSAAALGEILLIAGIVEGAVLIGWRLTQLPKSQALEFLLVSPVQPRRVFWSEAIVGLGRLALVTLAGLPLLVLLVTEGSWLAVEDLGPLLMMPFTWGAITGLGLTVWAYESRMVRRVGEVIVMLGILVYLVLGVLAAEQLGVWLQGLPSSIKDSAWGTFIAFHTHNPFGEMQGWFGQMPPGVRPAPPEWMFGLELCAAGALGLLLARAAGRLKGHFHDRHYRPIFDPTERNRGHIGNRPLSWWAVKRVTEYSGRINMWLAGGFGLVYAAYTMAGPAWPPWMGRRVFEIVEGVGGIASIATGLVVLAAVPAAFQYGLWDSNAQDRCRRLELLLLTDLEARDYWHAAAAAAWRRGRGYFFVAAILWGAATWAGKMDAVQLVAAVVSSLTLWALYFALGFRAFTSGMQANGLGSLLTLGLPLLAYGLNRANLPDLAALVPPGSVYAAAARPPSALWLLGPLMSGAAAVLLARQALAHCDRDLRRWYDLNHGQKGLD
jgi:hypothetical protein